MAWLALRAVVRTNATPQDTLADIGVLLMAALFLLSPNYPWYFLAVVPFIALGGGAPAWAMTLAAILLYKPLMLPDNDLAWKTLATAALRRRAWRPSMLRDSQSFTATSRSIAMDELTSEPAEPSRSTRAAISRPARAAGAASATSRRSASTWR